MRGIRILLHAAVVTAATSAISFGAIPDGPYFHELALPPGFGGTVKALGTLVTFQTNSEVWFWSAITREWTTIPISPAAQIAVFNDYATVLDGTVLHGYSTRHGVDTLNFSVPPSVQSGSPTSSWVSMAQVGGDVWGFGAFDGRWRHQSLASPVPTIKIAQTTALVHDGVNAYGFSAYFGEFVPVSVTAPTFLDVSGESAAANDAGMVRGFSSLHGTWASAPFTSTVPTAFMREYALYQSGTSFLMFSGVTGGFSQYQATTSTPLLVPENTVAMIVDGNDVAGYTACRDGVTLGTFSAPSIVIDDDVAVVVEAAAVTGFSGASGQFSSPLPGAYTVQTNQAVAYASDAFNAFGYSIVQNAWTPAPGVPSGLAVLRNVIVGTYGGGYSAFSGRSGTWIDQPSTTPSMSVANTSGDVFVAFENSDVRVFDPILLRWESVTVQGPLTLDHWRQTVVASDGVNGYGIGLMNNAWDTVPLQGNLVQLDANDACGYVLTDTHLYAYPGHGSLSSDSRWPEFTRFQPIGTDLPLHQRGPAGSLVLTFAGVGPAVLPAGGFGTFYVDPTLLVSFGLGTIPASGILDVKIPVPALSFLNGVTLHLQDVISTPSGVTYLTNSIAPVLL